MGTPHTPRLASDKAREQIKNLARVYATRDGDYGLQPSTWDPKSWSGLIREEWQLPEPITRRDVFAMVSAARTVDEAERAFLAVMLWGYGPTGYGPHRVRAMRDSRPEGLGQYMLEVMKAAQVGTVEAYNYMANNRATKLGPSYASKVAYFVTAGEVSPILDSEVARWVWLHQGKWLFNSNQWSTDQYVHFQTYCRELLNDVAPMVPVVERTLGLVEYLMFIDRAAAVLPAWVTMI